MQHRLQFEIPVLGYRTEQSSFIFFPLRTWCKNSYFTKPEKINEYQSLVLIELPSGNRLAAVSFFSRCARFIEKRRGKIGRFVSFNESYVPYTHRESERPDGVHAGVNISVAESCKKCLSILYGKKLHGKIPFLCTVENVIIDSMLFMVAWFQSTIFFEVKMIAYLLIQFYVIILRSLSYVQ